MPTESMPMLQDTNDPQGDGEAPSRLTMCEREIARLISRIERDETYDSITGIGADPDQTAQIIGVTGAPGSGKSTLVDVLAREIRADGRTVAILAIDPSSHLTGGAVLGDRVRMSSHSQDPGIYIRSMGTRGSTTGLANAARDAVRVLEGAGYDTVIVETVGVGQVELDVLTIADIIAVVLVPGLGDTMQMNKAGIMEIGDLYVVNMADRAETPGFVRELKQALAIGSRHADLPPVCKTIALTGDGIRELWEELKELDRRDRESGRRLILRKERRSKEYHTEIEKLALAMLRERMNESPSLVALRHAALDGWMSPRGAAREWVRRLSIRSD